MCPVAKSGATTSLPAAIAARRRRPSALAVFKIDYKFVFRRRLHRQVGRLLALENAIDVTSGASVLSVSQELRADWEGVSWHLPPFG
jgi:hypothetical protein